MSIARHGFGIEELDRALGGGLLPGTLTVMAGATGIGKTQLGLRWANTGLAGEGRRGVLCDLTSRGDSQNHAEYASRLFDWDLNDYPLTMSPDFERRLGFQPADRRLLPPDRSPRAAGHARRTSRTSSGTSGRATWRGSSDARSGSSTSISPAGAAGSSSTGSSRPSGSATRSSSSSSSTSTTTSSARRTNGPRGSGCGRSTGPSRPQVLAHRYDHRHDRLPVPLHDAAGHARRAAGAADQPGRHLRQRQHDHPDGPHPPQRPAGPGPRGRQASRQCLQRRDPALPDHRGRLSSRFRNEPARSTSPAGRRW